MIMYLHYPYLRDGSAYFAILMLFGSWLFVKTKKSIYIQYIADVQGAEKNFASRRINRL